MTKAGKEYRKLIKVLGLNQTQAGVYLGVGSRTSRRYARQGAPEPIIKLLVLSSFFQQILPPKKWKRAKLELAAETDKKRFTHV